MIIALRNRHFFTWMVLAVLLPIGFIAAYRSIPQKVTGSPAHGSIPPAFEAIIASEERADILVNIRKDISKNQLQAEIIIKRPLTRPSSFVYLGDDVKDAVSLGHLQSRGIYRFPLPDNLRQIRLLFHDQIKNETYDQILFKL